MCLGGRWAGQARGLENDLEQAQRRLRNSLAGLHPAGLYPGVVGVMGRGVKDSPSCFVLVSFNTSLALRRFSSDLWDVLDARLDPRGMMHRRTLTPSPVSTVVSSTRASPRYGDKSEYLRGTQ